MRTRPAILLLAVLAGCAAGPRTPGDFREEVETTMARYGLKEPEEGGSRAGATPSGLAAAEAWRRLRWQDEHGRIDPGALGRALDQRAAMIAALGGTDGPFGGRDGGLSRTMWVSRGPDNLGGRTCALTIDPRDSNVVIAGSVGGGLWRSIDGGATWAHGDDYMPALAIGSLERDPSNPDVIYAGGGEGFFNGDSIGGDGMYKSVDNGGTWALLPSTAGWDKVNSIAVHPTDTNIILVGRAGGISRSIDGGATWTTVRGARGSYCVKFDPTGRKAVGSVIDWNGSDWVHRAVYSGNSGERWFTSTGPLAAAPGFGSRIEVAVARGSPDTIYACTGLDGRIYRSTDGGRSYAARTTSGSTGAFGYCSPVWVSPTDPDLVIVGGGQPSRSTDGGVTITQISSGYILTDAPHPDIHGFVADPGYNGADNRRFWVLTDGGMASTLDITSATDAGWTRRFNRYRTTQFYAAVGHGPTGRLVGGAQDNGTLTLNPGSDAATLTYGGDGGFCAIDPLDPRFIYGEFIFLTPVRSSNGGTSVTAIRTGLEDAGTAANFIAPLVLDPTNPNILYGGGRSLWRTRTARTSAVWTRIKPAGTDNISAVAVAASDNRRVWIGQNNGEIFRTQTATASSPTWLTVDDNAAADPLPDRYITRILIDQADPDVVYVALGGWAADNLWRTTDGGATWSAIGGAGPAALPSAPIYGIARHPQNPRWLYVSTELGIYATSDGGLHWSTSNEGPANTRVDEINFLTGGSTVLVAATYGRGLWTADVRPCPADFNDDGFVDFFDYDEFVRCFEALACPPGGADLNHDAMTDFFDYLEFVEAFERGC